MNQFDRDDLSDFGSHTFIQTTGQNPSSSSSKMNLSSSQVKQQKNFSFLQTVAFSSFQVARQLAGMRRAQSVSICENTRVDLQRQTSLTRSRPTTPARTFTVTPTTIVHVDLNENGKNTTSNH